MGILETVMMAIKLGVDVAPYLKKLADTFKDGAEKVTDAQLEECRMLERALFEEIMAPLPPEEI